MALELTYLQSCSGISFKSQALYLIVYVTRYLGMVIRTEPGSIDAEDSRRHILDVYQLGMEHDLQAFILGFVCVYRLLDDKRLQADSRSWY